MYENEDYNKEITALRSRGKQREQAWLSESPEERKALKRKFPSPVRPYQENWGNSAAKDTVIPDYPPCPRCGAEEFDNEKVLDGVRHNGDGYGARYEICRGCGWTVWWLYDEA